MGLLDSFRKMFAPREGEDRAALSKRIQASPQDPQARQKLGIYLLRQGEIVEGLDQLARAAVMYEKDGFAGKAVAVLRQMLKHDPGNTEFQKWLIRLLAQQGRTADAVRELENVATRHAPFTSDEQRIEFFRQVGESLPRSPLPSLYIADIFRSQRKIGEAVNEMEKAARWIVPSGMLAEFGERVAAMAMDAGDNAELLETCGFLWLRIGRTGEALPLLSRVIEKTRLEEDLPRLEEMEKVLSAVREGWDAAGAEARSFADAARKMAEPPPAPLKAAPAPGQEPRREAEVDREEEGIVQNALSRLREKVHEEIGESDPDARYNLGIAYKEMGLLDEAAGEFTLARRKAELFVGASVLLADTLASKGDFEGALAALDEVLSSPMRTEAELRDVRYQKAVLLTRADRQEEAREIFLSIYDEAPGYRDVASRTEQYRTQERG